MSGVARKRYLYDQRADVVHVLNPSAPAVWEQCDGAHTPAEIGAYLAIHFAGVSELLQRQAGDAAAGGDPPVALTAVIGRAIAVESGGATYSLDSRAARLTGRAVATAFPLRRYLGLRGPAAELAWVAAACRRAGAGLRTPDTAGEGGG